MQNFGGGELVRGVREKRVEALAKSFLTHVYTWMCFGLALTGWISWYVANSEGAMRLYGYITKRDLSGMRSFLFMGLIGIIIASIVNIWLKSDRIMWAVSYMMIFGKKK